MKKKCLALTLSVLMLMGVLSSFTAFAATSNVPGTSCVDLTEKFTNDFFVKESDYDNGLSPEYGTGFGGTQWFYGDAFEQTAEDGVITKGNIPYKFGSVEGHDKNAILLVNDVTIDLGDEYLDYISIAATGRRSGNDTISYIVNYTDGTSDVLSSIDIEDWNPQEEPASLIVNTKRWVHRYKKVEGIETEEIDSFYYGGDNACINSANIPVTKQKRAKSVTFKKSTNYTGSEAAIFAVTKVYETTAAMAEYINANSDCYKTIDDTNREAALKFADYAKFALENGLDSVDVTDYETVSTINKRIRAEEFKTSPVDIEEYFTADYFAKTTDSVEDLQANLDATKNSPTDNGKEQWYNAANLEKDMKDGVLSVNGIDYKFGNLSGRAYNGVLLTKDTTIPLSGNELDSVYITASEWAWGNKTLSYVINYSDGTKSEVKTQEIGQWDVQDETTEANILKDVKRYLYRNRSNGAYANMEYDGGVGLIYAYRLPVDGGKKVSSITLKKSAQDNIAIFSVTEVYETVGEISAKIDAMLENYNTANIESYTAAQMSELFGYIDFAKTKGGVTDSDYNSEKVNALKNAYNDLIEEYAIVDLSNYFEYDAFMHENDVNKSQLGFVGNNLITWEEKGKEKGKIWFESEAVINAQDSDGYVKYNGLKYKFGSLTEYNKNAFGLYKETDGTKRYTQEIALSGKQTDRISILAARRSYSNSNGGILRYEVVYEDGSTSKGTLNIHMFGGNCGSPVNTYPEDKTPVITGYQVRYDYSDKQPGYVKVNSKGWEQYVYIYDYDIVADPSKKAVSVKLTENYEEPNIFVFAMTEVYPSAKTIKAGLANIPANVDAMNAENIDYVYNIDGWIALARAKNIAMPVDDATIAALKARAKLITNGLLIENGVKEVKDGALSFNADVYNFSGYEEGLDVYVAIAEYDGNKLINLNIVKNTVAKNNNKQTLSGTLSGVTNESSVKIMMLGGNLSPFADVK